MSKSGMVLFLSMIAAGLGLLGCSGGACGELDDVQKACCDKAPDEATKTSCYEQVDAQNNSSIADDVCEAATKAFMCTMPTQ